MTIKNPLIGIIGNSFQLVVGNFLVVFVRFVE